MLLGGNTNNIGATAVGYDPNDLTYATWFKRAESSDGEAKEFFGYDAGGNEQSIVFGKSAHIPVSGAQQMLKDGNMLLSPFAPPTPVGRGAVWYLPAGATPSVNNTCNAVRALSGGNWALGGEVIMGSNGAQALLKLKPDLTIDKTFGNDGWWFYIPGSGAGAVIQGMAVQSDGKILMSGGSFLGGEHATVSRIKTDGTPDTSFGGTGTVGFLPGTAVAALSFCCGQEPGGKILVGGSAQMPDGSIKHFCTRLNANGTVDTSYGTSGSTIWNCGANGSGGAAWGMAIDSSGRAVIGGTQTTTLTMTLSSGNGAGGNHLFVTGFNGVTAGMTTKVNPGGGTQESVLLIRVTVANSEFQIVPVLANTHSSGETATVASNSTTCTRLDTSGNLDTSFNSVGYNYGIFGIKSTGLAIAIQSNGKIVVAGGGVNPAGTVVGSALTRFNTDGTVDNTYGVDGNGTAYIKWGSNAVVVQSDDKMINGNLTPVAAPNRTTATRFKTNGAVDTDFATGGTVYNPSTTWFTPNGVAVDNASGYICAAGVGNSPSGVQSFAACRIDPSGNIDRSVGVGT